MHDKNDAFGHALLEYHQGHDAVSVIERDDGYLDLDSVEHYFTEPRRWHKSERDALRLARGRVLDVGSGAGRVALHLQARGLKVTAIDNSRLAVQVCKKRGVKDARVVPISLANTVAKNLDTVVLFGNNFGLLRGLKCGREYLRLFYRMTTSRGRIIAQTMDPYATSNPAHLNYHRSNLKKKRMGGQVRIRCRYRNWCNQWFDYLFVSRDELTNLVSGTGWRVTKTLSTDGPEYIVVLEKECRP